MVIVIKTNEMNSWRINTS